MKVALTIAGSDSGGGAGIQADLNTFSALKVFGTSVITCVTAQNPDAVLAIQEIRPAMVASQIQAVFKGFPVAAAKTGMLHSAPVIQAVARELQKYKPRCLVVDPVMIATSGVRLLRQQAVRMLCSQLLPLATVVTPNRDEAAVLYGQKINSPADQEAATRELSKRFNTAFLVKGGHMPGDTVCDMLFYKNKMYRFRLPRVKARQTHGSGCTMSAALTAFLALGASLPQAAQKAQETVQQALQNSTAVGRHHPLRWSK